MICDVWFSELRTKLRRSYQEEFSLREVSKVRGGGVRRLAIIAPLPYTQYHVLGFHAYALPTHSALTSVCGFSKLLCLWPPRHNHLRETEVTQWQLNSWEEMSSCHHGIKMPEDAGLLSGKCWVHSSLNVERSSSRMLERSSSFHSGSCCCWLAPIQ